MTVNEFDNKKTYIRKACYAAGLVVVALLQNTEGLLPSFFGIRAFVLIPALVSIAMFERELSGMFFGVFAGLLWDVSSASGGHFQAIMMTAIGFICGSLITYLMRNNLITGILLSAGSLVVHSLLCWLKDYIFSGNFDGAYKLLTFYIPSCIYTMLFFPLFYFLVRFARKKLN